MVVKQLRPYLQAAQGEKNTKDWALQNTPEIEKTDLYKKSKSLAFPGKNEAVHKCTKAHVAAQGFEAIDATGLPDNDLGKSGKTGAAECAANPMISCEIDADLQVVADAWPSLSEADRQTILTIIEVVRGQGR